MSTPSLYIFSPAGALQDGETLARARSHLEKLGFQVTIDRAATKRWQRFAGTDSERINAFTRALKSKAACVLASRGGYGITRILPQLNFAELAKAPNLWCGYSDFSAFHYALIKAGGKGAVAGPMASKDFGVEKVDKFTQDSFLQLFQANTERQIVWESSGMYANAQALIRGRLWGGNLSMTCSLLATPYIAKPRNAIMFFEDVGESPYQIERMLLQLLQSGFFKGQRALLFGSFTQYQLSAHDNSFSLATVFENIAKQTQLPVITGLAYGHDAHKVSLPLNHMASLAIQNNKIVLVY